MIRVITLRFRFVVCKVGTEYLLLRVAVMKRERPWKTHSAPSTEQALRKWWPLRSSFADRSYELKVLLVS